MALKKMTLKKKRKYQKNNLLKIIFFILLFFAQRNAMADLAIENSLEENKKIRINYRERINLKRIALKNSMASIDLIFSTEEERKVLTEEKKEFYKSAKFSQVIKGNNIHIVQIPRSIETSQTNKESQKNKKQEEISHAGNILFKGIVKRSDGKSFIWVNNQQPSPLIATDKINQINKISSKISNGEYQVELRPGQVWLKSSKKITEGYLISDPTL